MSEVLEILSPNRRVKIGAKEITVKELTWMQQRQLLGDLQTQIAALLTAEKGGNKTEHFSVVLDLIRSSQELSERVLKQATALDDTALQQLSTSEFLGLLDVVLDLNVTSLVSGAKKCLGRITSSIGKGNAALTTPISP